MYYKSRKFKLSDLNRLVYIPADEIFIKSPEYYFTRKKICK